MSNDINVESIKNLGDELIVKYEYNVEKMYTYLRGLFEGAGLVESMKALQFAREKHAGQTRKNGTPYIVHPLQMACYAVALGIRKDSTIATILYHDVPEDCGVCVENLPTTPEIKHAVKCMTVTKLKTDKNKMETKRRYFWGLLENSDALICKGIDRYMNLIDMPFALSDTNIGKNVAETEVLLLPVMKEGKEKWIELSNILFILRTNIRGVNDAYKLHYKEDYLDWYKKYTE